MIAARMCRVFDLASLGLMSAMKHVFSNLKLEFAIGLNSIVRIALLLAPLVISHAAELNASFSITPYEADIRSTLPIRLNEREQNIVVLDNTWYSSNSNTVDGSFIYAGYKVNAVDEFGIRNIQVRKYRQTFVSMEKSIADVIYANVRLHRLMADYHTHKQRQKDLDATLRSEMKFPFLTPSMVQFKHNYETIHRAQNRIETSDKLISKIMAQPIMVGYRIKVPSFRSGNAPVARNNFGNEGNNYTLSGSNVQSPSTHGSLKSDRIPNATVSKHSGAEGRVPPKFKSGQTNGDRGEGVVDGKTIKFMEAVIHIIEYAMNNKVESGIYAFILLLIITTLKSMVRK
ncbi:MAG: hypothetical protein HKP58_11305 [Desulfatitalea sp.]|nr:hypothetical protein [Desulfatitalea sp.]NNK00989.1 hypothetical protein [Desulfatitalea sp.]